MVENFVFLPRAQRFGMFMKFVGHVSIRVPGRKG